MRFEGIRGDLRVFEGIRWDLRDPWPILEGIGGDWRDPWPIIFKNSLRGFEGI